ncbi:MAG: NmrA-like protein, partial [Rhizobacter sp.]|nr:NmrA-like protein [Rhizobacter sp.]
PVFDPAPGFPESRGVVEAVFNALTAAKPQRVLALSTIGVQSDNENVLTQLQLLERRLSELPMPVAYLRAAWFMENTIWDIASARDRGVIDAFLQPSERPVPMVATQDVADAAADLLTRGWQGRLVVEIEGPVRVSPLDIARTLGGILNREVTVNEVARRTWEALFRSQGMCHPIPRMRMLDGFNEGWIEFEQLPGAVRHGATSLSSVLSGLVAH